MKFLRGLVDNPRAVDSVVVVLATVFVLGAYVIAYAYVHDPGRILQPAERAGQTTVTAAWALLTLFLFITFAMGLRAGRQWNRALPDGQTGTFAAALIFGAAWIVDAAFWSQLFGNGAVGLESLFTPPHLVEMAAGAVMVSGPLRAATRRGEAVAGPVTLTSAALLLSVLTFATQFAHPLIDPWPAGDYEFRNIAPAWLRENIGMAALLAQAAILAGTGLLLNSAFKLRPGSLTFVFTLNGIFVLVTPGALFRRPDSAVLTSAEPNLPARYAPLDPARRNSQVFTAWVGKASACAEALGVGRTARIPTQLTKRPFSLDEALRVGLTKSSLRGKSWRRLGAELYCWSGLAVDPWMDLSAWLRQLPPDAVFAGKTAAWLFGLDLDPLNPIELIVPSRSGVRSRPGLSVRRGDIATNDVVKVRGLPATTVHRTLSDLCLRLPKVEALVAIDVALRLRLTNKSALTGAGTRSLRSLAVLAEPAESPMETRLRWLLLQAGLPRPHVQSDLHDGEGRFVGRADLYYPVARLVIEYDGRNHQERLVEDNRRQNLLINAGFRILRFTAADVNNEPDIVAARVRSALDSAPLTPTERNPSVRYAPLDTTRRNGSVFRLSSRA